MEVFWYCALTFLLIAYAALDGFDLGAGSIHLYASKNEQDRENLIKSIGPFWDGNEVCLISAGGLLVMCFPKAYASAFSGLYLPLIMVLWLLCGRAISLEFRHLLDNPLWHQFWDVVFSLSSLLLSIFFGAALGNLVRGVPLDAEGYFFAPLWTSFTPESNAGILDWFTVLFGLLSLFTFITHGANYVAMRTLGELRKNCHEISKKTSIVTAIISIVTTACIPFVQPLFFKNYLTNPWGILFPLLTLASLAAMIQFRKQDRDTASFVSSTAFIATSTTSMAFGLFPHLLISTTAHPSLTAYNTLTGKHSLEMGIIWWPIGICLAIVYFSFVFYSFRGKISSSTEGY